MKLASFEIANAPTYGIVTESGGRRSRQTPDRRSFSRPQGAARGQRTRRRRAVAATSPDAPLDAVQWRPVIPNPGKIFCIGHNYEEHRLETGRPKTAYPAVFVRFAASQVGHERRPAVSARPSEVRLRRRDGASSSARRPTHARRRGAGITSPATPATTRARSGTWQRHTASHARQELRRDRRVRPVDGYRRRELPPGSGQSLDDAPELDR